MLGVKLTQEEFESLYSNIIPTIINNDYYITHLEAVNTGLSWITSKKLIDYER